MEGGGTCWGGLDVSQSVLGGVDGHPRMEVGGGLLGQTRFTIECAGKNGRSSKDGIREENSGVGLSHD